jgi:signal peptidase
MPSAPDAQSHPAFGFPEGARVTIAARIARRVLELGLAGLAVGILATVVLVRGVPLTGRHVLVVGGGSMEPVLSLGSAIIVEPIPVSSLAVGDIVTIRVGPDQAIFTHRITRLVHRPDGLWIETKGDANASTDGSIIPATSVEGRLVMAIPRIGYVVAGLSQPSGLAAALGMAGLLLALIMLLDGPSVAAPAPARPTRRLIAEPAGIPMPVPSMTANHRRSSGAPRRR